MSPILSTSVVWFLVGLALFLGELVVPGLVLIFFGIGAWVTALCCLFFDVSINTQLLLFLIASLTSLVLLRKVIREKYITYRRGSSHDWDDDYTGQKVTALQDFGGEIPGKVLFRGTEWDASCSTAVSKGQILVIKEFKSIRLIVEPINTIESL